MVTEAVYIILPVYNESPVVLQQVVDELLERDYKLIVVDDGSSERIDKVLRGKAVTLLRHPVNLGQGAALQTGFEYARQLQARYVVTFDADGQHTPDSIEKLLEPILKGSADIVLGSRFLPGASHNAPMFRRLLFRLAHLVNAMLVRLPVSDSHNGLRALNAKALASICLTENRMAHATEILLQIKSNRLRYAEVPVQIRYSSYARKKGQSAADSIKVFFDLVLHKLFE
ncbi:MAG TPA: glycosyltransferase family 2 protein [Flavisolibacter sp.]|jgi:glycosyltransferase involved in cell wall biosynthesis|nr:glycosyltransferase family 2 protein [Flavisolibacter sp.]